MKIIVAMVLSLGALVGTAQVSESQKLEVQKEKQKQVNTQKKEKVSANINAKPATPLKDDQSIEARTEIANKKEEKEAREKKKVKTKF